MADKPNIPTVGSSANPEVRRALNAIKDYLLRLEASGALSGGTGTGTGAGTVINNITNPTVGIEDPGTAIPAHSGVSAQGLFNSIMLTWGSPGNDYFWLAKTEIYWSLDPNISDVVAEGNYLTAAPYPQAMLLWTPPDTALSQTYHFWLRYVTISDRLGAFTGPFSASTADDPAYVKEVLANEITESEIFQDLNDRIDLTDNIVQMQYDISGNATAISNETQARTTETTALAQDISTVAAVAGNNTTAIQTEATARADADDLAYAEYTIKVNANGKIAGIGIAVDGTAGQSGPISSIVQVLADTFAIAHPTNPAEPDIIPFVVSNGKVYMDTAYIENATITNAHIENVRADQILAGSITAALAIYAPYLANAQTNASAIIDLVNNYIKFENANTGDFSLLTTDDLSYHIAPRTTPAFPGATFKAPRRVLALELSGGDSYTFNPPFYTDPKAVVSMKTALTFDYTHGTIDQGFDVYLTNLDATGFDVVAEHTSFDNPTAQTADLAVPELGNRLFTSPSNCRAATITVHAVIRSNATCSWDDPGGGD